MSSRCGAPERLTRAPPWREPQCLRDRHSCVWRDGPRCRTPWAGGKPAVIPFGLVPAPRAPKGIIIAARDYRQPYRHRGDARPMVRGHHSRPGERSGLPYLKVSGERVYRYRICLSSGRSCAGGDRPATRNDHFGGLPLLLENCRKWWIAPDAATPG